MFKQMMTPKTTVAVLALAGMAVVYAGNARAQNPEAWCAYYTDKSTNCGFATMRQCRDDVAGIGGFCSPNPASN